MKSWLGLNRIVRVWLPGGALLALGGCLSDVQVSTIIASVITTGLSTLINQALFALTGTSTGTGA